MFPNQRPIVSESPTSRSVKKLQFLTYWFSFACISVPFPSVFLSFAFIFVPCFFEFLFCRLSFYFLFFSLHLALAAAHSGWLAFTFILDRKRKENEGKRNENESKCRGMHLKLQFFHESRGRRFRNDRPLIRKHFTFPNRLNRDLWKKCDFWCIAKENGTKMKANERKTKGKGTEMKANKKQ